MSNCFGTFNAMSDNRQSYVDRSAVLVLMEATSTTAGPLFEERFRAIRARDPRFDGQFFFAVTSTGIYCRPSCPARTPKPSNVRFFQTAAAAHEAGFRACKRCLPDATADSPLWNVRGDVSARAMRLISDGVVDREGVEGLARRLDYSTRHIHRLLTHELGAGPRALARARRAQSARALLVGTDLSMVEVAFAAGFGSVRQFNETIDEVYELSPKQLRAKARQIEPSIRDGSDRVHLTIDLPVRQPFDAPGIFGFLAARAVPGVESIRVDDDAHLRYARTLVLPHGPAAVDIVARSGATNGRWKLTAQLELTSLTDVAPAVSRIRRLLDLDADPVAVDTALAADPLLAPLVAATPGIRVPGAIDAEELVVRALVGQQISVRAATGHLGRMVEQLGTPYSSSIAGLTMLFPSSKQIAGGVPAADVCDPDRPLRLPAQSINAVRAVTGAMANGDVQIHSGMETEALRDLLLRQPRIGPWSTSYIAMRVLGDPDIWMTGDAALLSGAKRLGWVGPNIPSRTAQRLLVEMAGSWSPWRSFAAMHVWQAASGPASKAAFAAAPGSTVLTSESMDSVSFHFQGVPMNNLFSTTLHTPDGPFSVVSSDEVVLASGWTDDISSLLALIHSSLRPGLSDVHHVDPDREGTVASIADAVRRYYDGDLMAPRRIEVRQRSGEFRQHAWDVLRDVRPGEPITYTEYAARSGRPAAVRAAASACAMNAAALFVPCHRILRSDGGLGGFRYGLEIKKSLLEREVDA